jgi:N-acylglucosamine 2-epimerase
MKANLTDPQQREHLRTLYRDTLLHDVMPFWLQNGMDREFDGIITSLDRDGSILDTDKSIWFQGRAAWMFSTLYNTVEKRSDWADAAGSCLAFLEKHGYATDGKLFFTVTREGRPLRMRRYVFSEAFASIAHAAYAKATGDESYAERAKRDFASYLRHSFEKGLMQPKVNSETRPMIGIGALMIGIATAQELRLNLGDVKISGHSCSEWADRFILEIERFFFKPDLGVLMEVVSPDGSIIDHFDGRTLNPGHALECAWFILHEGRWRGEKSYVRLGLQILDCMWQRGWDAEKGGLFYFRDLHGKPVQEYWYDMKFANWHQQVHDWSFAHFPDAQHGEWFGYLHRDGSPSVTLKGNMWKGPFHLPRMLWYCWQLLEHEPHGTKSL